MTYILYNINTIYLSINIFEGSWLVINNEYADLIVEYSGDYTVFNRFPTAEYTIINYQYAVVHIPLEVLTFDLIKEWGYSVLPKAFGLTSALSLEAAGITMLRRIPNFNLRGRGVLIGFVDTGIDYLNPVFQYTNNTTRIVSIWDQTITSENTSESVIYGTEYTREEINLAIASENPMDIVPSRDENGHGTMIAGIAAGNEVPESNFYGIATDSEIVFVKLRQAKQLMRDFYLIPDGAVCYSEVDILFGIYYLLEVSNTLRRPLVICFALGSSQGGHSGRGPLSNTLSTIGRSPGVAVVVAAGNEGNERRHYYGIADRITGYDTVELRVGEGENGFTMEFWGEYPNIYSLDITSPTGEYIPRMVARINESYTIPFLFERTTINILFELVETQFGAQVILLRFTFPSPGIWRFNIYERGDINLGFHMWLPMGNFISNETFFLVSDTYTTILEPGNASVPITVTAYNYLDNSLYLNASRGYTRTGQLKPNIAAPGMNVVGPVPRIGFMEFTGTGVAAAFTSGVVAMIMEWGYVRNNFPNLNTVSIKVLMQRGARRSQDILYPNREWGYGILDVYQMFQVLRLEVR